MPACHKLLAPARSSIHNITCAGIMWQIVSDGHLIVATLEFHSTSFTVYKCTDVDYV